MQRSGLMQAAAVVGVAGLVPAGLGSVADGSYRSLRESCASWREVGLLKA